MLEIGQELKDCFVTALFSNLHFLKGFGIDFTHNPLPIGVNVSTFRKHNTNWQQHIKTPLYCNEKGEV